MFHGSLCRVGLLVSLLLLSACKTELFASLPEGEANEIVGILLASGITASKTSLKDGLSAVAVEQADFPRAVALLKQQGLPHKQFQTMGDVFGQSGMVTSPMQERARLLWALGQELSSTVSQIDGVLTARVQVVLPDNDLMRKEPAPASASVFIRHTAQSPAPKLVAQIKALVANSIEGLTYDKVSVILVTAEAPELPPVMALEEKTATLGAAVGAGILAIVGTLLYIFRHHIMILLRRAALVARE